VEFWFGVLEASGEGRGVVVVTPIVDRQEGGGEGQRVAWQRQMLPCTHHPEVSTQNRKSFSPQLIFLCS
jgi:hypothetical protein